MSQGPWWGMRDCCCSPTEDPPPCWGFALSGITDPDCLDCTTPRYMKRATLTTPGVYVWSCSMPAWCPCPGSAVLGITKDKISLTVGGATWTKNVTSLAEAFSSAHDLFYESGAIRTCDVSAAACRITPGYDANGRCPCECVGRPCGEGTIFQPGTTPAGVMITIDGDITNKNPAYCPNCNFYKASYALLQAGPCSWSERFSNIGGCGSVLGSPYLGISLSVGTYSNPTVCTPGDAEWRLEMWVYRPNGISTTLVIYYGCVPRLALPMDGTNLGLTLSKYYDGPYCIFPPTVEI